MLSEEEEILIKKLRYCEQEYEQNGYLSVGKFEAIKEAGNLLEKQSKEIEELKEKNEFLNWYFENQKENFIYKGKIKAKIEELENDPNNLEEHNCLRADTCYVINVLQSLLEK